MTRWLYHVVTISTKGEHYIGREPYSPYWIPSADEILQETLSKLGRDGWELTGFVPADPTSYHAIFKQSEEIQERSMEQEAIGKSIRRHIAKQSRRK
jgi:hypothetical protein